VVPHLVRKNLEKLYRVSAALLSARAVWIMVNPD
jgi:hypothetical protein